jgi:hypothetical protein
MAGLRDKIKPENRKPYEYKKISLEYIKEIINGWNNLIRTNRKYRKKLK